MRQYSAWCECSEWDDDSDDEVGVTEREPIATKEEREAVNLLDNYFGLTGFDRRSELKLARIES